jgi:hypothetical protein
MRDEDIAKFSDYTSTILDSEITIIALAKMDKASVDAIELGVLQQ